MKFLLDLAATQSVGIMVGIFLIFLIDPDTSKGALFLIVASVAFVNAVREIARTFSGKSGGGAPGA